MSANQMIRELFEIALGNDVRTQTELDSFLETNPSWLRYPDHCTWDEVMRDALRHCSRVLNQRIKTPAIFIND